MEGRLIKTRKYTQKLSTVGEKIKKSGLWAYLQPLDNKTHRTGRGTEKRTRDSFTPPPKEPKQPTLGLPPSSKGRHLCSTPKKHKSL